MRSNTRLVVVDVIATSGNGTPITDLKAEDFIVTENGKPQEVRNFSLEQPLAALSSQSPAQPSRIPQLPAGVFTNAPSYKAASVWNVILLDFLNSQVLSQADLRQQLVKVLDKVPDAPVAIFVLTNRLYLLHDFSSNRAALKQLILELKNNASANLDNPKGGHEMERYSPSFIAALPPQLLENLVRAEVRMTTANTAVRLRQTVEALNAVVRHLAALPGRKNLIWVSQAFPFSIEPGSIVRGFDSATGRGYDISVPTTANALLDSQVAIYPIDPLGIQAPDEFDSANRHTDPIGRKQTDQSVSDLHYASDVTHASVNELAERTGGRAFYNVNDTGDAIVRSMRDGSTYYTLAYYPTDKKWDGKFRRIGVKVNRGGVKLRYRLGYFAIDPSVVTGTDKVRAEQAEVFQQAMELSAPVSTALIFQAKVIPPSPSHNDVVVNFLLQPGVVSMEKGADGQEQVSVACAVRAFNEKGEPVNAAGNTMAGALKPEARDQIMREGFPCRQVLELAPGKYFLRLGVRDNLSGRIGTADASVVLP